MAADRKRRRRSSRTEKTSILVVDEDGHEREPFLRDCARRGTKKQNWHGIVSRPCFEVWLVAHYEQVRRYPDQKAAQAHYRRLIPDTVGEKELPSDFPYDDVADAVPRSHLKGEAQSPLDELPPTPGTGMPHLVRRLGLAEPE